MKRGELWWAQVDKRRPVVLVSRDEAYDVRELVLAVPVSTTVRGFAAEVRLGRRDGLPKPCVANCDVVGPIPKSSLEERIGALSPARIRALDESLGFVLGLDP
ncbi:MAG: type II toxin-antitoxin system PemK/MazF family toxin [Myxococcota bacterium]